MDWFKYFVFSYFIIHALVSIVHSIKHTDTDALTDILAATFFTLTAIGIWYWL